MLTGNQVRLKFHKGTVLPQYLDARDPQWLAAAEELIDLYRAAKDRTRGEVAADVIELVGDSPATLVQQGLAKLLDDRCEYETVADRPPEDVREVALKHSEIHRAAMAMAGQPFDRAVVLEQTAAELAVSIEKVETLLFADLKDELRVLSFDGTTAEKLIERYNVALVQAILLRSVGLEIRVWGETAARFRQLFRKMRFHKLIASIKETQPEAYDIRIDGPLSLFSATSKYGLQLALFLPALLHCKAFELRAELRWGAARRRLTFDLSSHDNLRSHLPDFGVFTPPEFDAFAASFQNLSGDWDIHNDPQPLSLPDGVWVPDFTITHRPSGKSIYLEMFGYWRRVDLEKHYDRLNRLIPKKFLLVVSEQYRTDEEEGALPDGIVTYKRLPSPNAVIDAANHLIR